MQIELSLLVLRCRDVEATRRFYEKLGLVFTEERHGTGPRHYVWQEDGFVLELYRSTAGQPPDNVRLGFSTPLLADVSGTLLHDPEVTVLKPPYTTADRLSMLVQDPDGRKVEVGQPLHY
jgi:catechol 2,3-dioxygenase-like lactoylglutathione lyase family enzyme